MSGALHPVSASAVARLRLDRGRRAYEVDVHLDGLTFSALVVGDRVAVPFARGAEAVRFTDAALEAHCKRAAVEAARDAERRGYFS